MLYENLKAGDKLRQGDEYSTAAGAWKEVPNFMIGDKIPDSKSTQWRRLLPDNKPPEKKKGWFSL